MRTQLESVTKSRDSVRTGLRDLRSNLKFTSVEAIDAQVAALEHRQAHATLSLAEEKRLLEDIRALNKSRATVAELTAGMGRLEADDSSRTSLQDGLRGLGDALTALRAEEDGLKARLAELQAEAAAKGATYPDWKNEVAQCREVCKQAYEKIKELRAENDERWAAYKVANAEWREQDAAERKRKYEERQREREARDAEWAARALENQPEPYDREVR